MTKPKWWENSKTQVVTKLKKIILWQNMNKSNFDKAQKLKKSYSSKTQIVVSPKNSNSNKTQPKLWQNAKTQIVTKPKTHLVTKLQIQTWQLKY